MWLFASVLLVMLVVTLAVTSAPEVTAPQVWRTLGGMALCFSLIDWLRADRTQPRRMRAIVTVLLLLGLSLAVAAPFIVEWTATEKAPIIPTAIYRSFRLMTADSVNANVMAGALVMLLPIALALFILGKGSPPERGLASIAFCAMLAVLLLTQSRSGWFASIVSMAVVLLFRWRRLAWSFSAILAVIVVLFILSPTLRQHLDAGLSSVGSVAGIDQRLEIWARALYLVQDFSFTGAGMGLFQQVTARFYPLVISPSDIPHAHNLFLQIAVDLGIPGLIAWLGILTNVIIACVVSTRSTLPLVRAIGAGLLASNVALCVHGLTDAVTWGMVRTAPLVWALWGLAVAAGIIAEQRARQPQALAREPAEK